MWAKNINRMVALAAGAALTGCNTPCDAPGRLCAPISSMTSDPARTGALRPPRPQLEANGPQTFGIAAPGQERAPAGAPQRIALLLPLHSATLGPAAAAVRDGFLTAYERERDGFSVTVIDSGEAAAEVLAAYLQAQREHEVIVGPLTRPAVDAVAASTLPRKPTIALNRGSAGEGALPPHMLAIGLSLEEEARQVARWAGAEQPGASALIVTAGTAWQRRSADAFAQDWQQQGRRAGRVAVQALDGVLGEADLARLREQIQNQAPGLIFAALDAAEARQLRSALEREITLYGTSALNPGRERGVSETGLNGVRLLDLPWQVQPNAAAVAPYPRGPQLADADSERLYALGIDAFRIARVLALHPAQRFTLDGVTGRLTVDFERGRFERIEQGAIYRDGELQAAPQAR